MTEEIPEDMIGNDAPRIEGTDIVERADKLDHDYEPGKTTHPMHTDPLCRVCGRPKH